jgi:hypothetical protein
MPFAHFFTAEDHGLVHETRFVAYRLFMNAIPLLYQERQWQNHETKWWRFGELNIMRTVLITLCWKSSDKLLRNEFVWNCLPERIVLMNYDCLNLNLSTMLELSVCSELIICREQTSYYVFGIWAKITRCQSLLVMDLSVVGLRIFRKILKVTAFSAQYTLLWCLAWVVWAFVFIIEYSCRLFAAAVFFALSCWFVNALHSIGTASLFRFSSCMELPSSF